MVERLSVAQDAESSILSDRPKFSNKRGNMIIPRILGIFGVIAVAATVFYGAFFKLAPYIGSVLPASNWTPFLKVLVYILIAWFGGVAVPIWILCFGMITVVGLTSRW